MFKRENLNEFNLVRWLKNVFIGKAKNPLDKSVFHNISLVAFFAWVGLGADGLSSSCYGPAEAFITLGRHFYLGIIVAVASAVTIFIIAESYNQIIELFPQGGGGYLVAGKLLSPTVGMISGAALLIDYILTITISAASGADALFSLFPIEFLPYKLWFALAIVALLILLNLRGVKESITVLMPIFLMFIATHLILILWAIVSHAAGFGGLAQATTLEIKSSVGELGILGTIFLILKAYSMGAGTYTGIEAVSNGVSILREPRVKTAQKTLFYMVISLALVVLGLMFAYTFFQLEPQAGKTLNAILFDRVVMGWGLWGYGLVLLALFSEAALLFVAAQAGFIDGPRVLATMAVDRWVPKRLALLSDRLVAVNGILIMGFGALVLMLATRGNVAVLVVLYSINVFITFCLSQTGMVKHWWEVRHENSTWIKKILVNGIGLILTGFILVSVTVLKFHDGGWVTLFITGTVVALMWMVRQSYLHTRRLCREMDVIVGQVEKDPAILGIKPLPPGIPFDPDERTAVIFVKDYTGIGLKTLRALFKSFGGGFKNIVFVQLGLINAGVFKGHDELEKIKAKVEEQISHYVEMLSRFGYHAEGVTLYGIDTVDEAVKAARQIVEKYPQATFFGGQIVFPRNTFWMRLLHNYTLFSIQKHLYEAGIPLFVLPIELSPKL